MWLLAKLRANQGLDLNIAMLKFTGLWPATSNARKTTLDKLRDIGLLLYSFMLLLAFSLMVPLGALNSRDDLVAVFECVGICFGGFATLAKVFIRDARPNKMACFYFQSSSIKSLTARIASLSHRARTLDHKNEDRLKIAGNTQMFINVFASLAFIYIVVVEVGMISRQCTMFPNRKHFTRLWFFIDPYESPTYEIIFVLWTVTLCYTFMLMSVMDCFVAAVLTATIGQLQLLRLDISRISEDAVEIVRKRREKCEVEIRESFSITQDDAVNWEPWEQNFFARKKENIDEERLKLMGDYVYRYQECVKIVRELEATLGPILATFLVGVVLSQLAGIIFVFTDPGALQGTMDEVELEEYRLVYWNALLGSVSFACIASIEFAVFCFMANMISDESELVRDSVYNCDWFDATEGFKRSMRIIMSCCNQPLVIKVAAFIPLSMETYLKTMNLAYSYYAFLESTAF